MPEPEKSAATLKNPAKALDAAGTPLPGGVLVLHTQEELKIFVNPQRMRLVNLLETMGEPATAKALADHLGISASSVKHHLNKLESIGLVEVDHQAHIHGILATYYRPTARTVVFDQTNAALRPLAQLAVEHSMQQVMQGALQALAAWQADPAATWDDAWGLLQSDGVMYLTQGEALALRRQILDFLESHKAPRPGAAPIHFGVVSYRAGEPGPKGDTENEK